MDSSLTVLEARLFLVALLAKVALVSFDERAVLRHSAQAFLAEGTVFVHPLVRRFHASPYNLANLLSRKFFLRESFSDYPRL